MATTPKHIIVILCGGTGPRLWPLSRATKPKQFLKIFGNNSLLQDTYHRAQKIVPLSQIFVISNQRYRLEIKKHLPLLPTQNLILEPAKKNTTMALIYSTVYIQKLFPDCVITSFPADHYIGSVSNFIADIKKTALIARQKSNIIAIGIKPTSPNPAYGYVLPPHKFYEKPSPDLASKLIAKGAFWNSGIYTFTPATLQSEINHYQKEYSVLWDKLSTTPRNLVKIYELSPNLSIDVAVSEKTKNLEMITASFDWSDIGEWQSIYHHLPQKDSFSVINKKTNFVQFNSQKCLLSGSPQKLIGLVGVENLAIIDTPDALLICNIAYNDSYHVKDLITQIVSHKKTSKYFLK